MYLRVGLFCGEIGKFLLGSTVQKHIEQPIGDDETNLSDNSDEFEDDDSGGSLSDNHCDRFAHHDTKNLSTDLQVIKL